MNTTRDIDVRHLSGKTLRVENKQAGAKPDTYAWLLVWYWFGGHDLFVQMLCYRGCVRRCTYFVSRSHSPRWPAACRFSFVFVCFSVLAFVCLYVFVFRFVLCCVCLLLSFLSLVCFVCDFSSLRCLFLWCCSLFFVPPPPLFFVSLFFVCGDVAVCCFLFCCCFVFSSFVLSGRGFSVREESNDASKITKHGKTNNCNRAPPEWFRMVYSYKSLKTKKGKTYRPNSIAFLETFV